MDDMWKDSEFSRRANWEEIRKLAAANTFVRAAIEFLDAGKLDEKEALMLAVLLQDDALRNIEKLQTEGWKYGE